LEAAERSGGSSKLWRWQQALEAVEGSGGSRRLLRRREGLEAVVERLLRGGEEDERWWWRRRFVYCHDERLKGWWTLY
jgi:hypothetical protein